MTKQRERSGIIASLIVMVMVLAVAMTGCAPYAYFDDDARAVSGSNHMEVMSAMTTIDGKTTWAAGKFNGVKTIATLTLEANAVLRIDELTVESGEFRLVLVTQSEVVADIREVTDGRVQLQNVAGTYRLRAIGKDAKFKIVTSFALKD